VLNDLHVRAPASISVQCDVRTIAGRGYSPGGSLFPSDQVACRARLSTGAVTAVRSLAISARDSNQRIQVRSFSLAHLAGGPVTPGQGILILLGAGIHNDGNSNGLLEAGESINYHYTLINRGSLALSALAATDLAGAVTCPQPTLAVGASMVCTRVYVITAGDQGAGLVFNDIEVTGQDASAQPVQAGDVVLTQNLGGSAGIRVVKSPLLLNDADNNGFASVGDLLRYTFAVKNSNAQTLTSVLLTEPDPTRIDTPIVCEAQTLGGQAFSGNGTGTLLANDAVLCTADYTIRLSDAAIGQVLNLVEAGGTAAIAGPVVGTGASAVVMPSGGELMVTKTANIAQTQPGGTVIYTITVTNTGSFPIVNVTISDPLPAGVASFNWTCAGVLCPTAAGTGAINHLVASFPPAGQLVYTVTATLTGSPPSTVTNIVLVTPSSAVTCSPAATPPPCQASSPVGVLQPLHPVPGLGLWGVLLLAWLLGFVGLARTMPRSRVQIRR
jgi:uncharacterized repeat protein (TIGR01451 family)